MVMDDRIKLLAQRVAGEIKALRAEEAARPATKPLWTSHYPMVPIPGVLYFPVGGANTTLTMTLNRIYYIPVTVSRKVRLASWGIEVTTGTASSSIRSSVYRNLGEGGVPSFLPGPKLVDAAATASGTTTGNKTFAPASALDLLPTEVYWFGVTAQGAALPARSRASSDPFVTDRSAGANILIATNSAYWQGAISGANPSPAGAEAALTAANSPALFVTFTEAP